MAVTVTAAELAEAIGADQATADLLLPVATELVNRYAPDAPDAVGNTAVLRCAGCLHQAPASGARRKSVGPLDASYSPNNTGALRFSPAQWRCFHRGRYAGRALSADALALDTRRTGPRGPGNPTFHRCGDSSHRRASRGHVTRRPSRDRGLGNGGGAVLSRVRGRQGDAGQRRHGVNHAGFSWP